MKFQITIKQQAQAVNGKAKYPLYKQINDKNLDDDKGLQALNQLIDNSSIKIFCDQCEKEITLETIIIAYEGGKPTTQKEIKQFQTQKISVQEKKETILVQERKEIPLNSIIQPQNVQKRSQKPNQTKQPKQSHLSEELFEQEEEDNQHNEKESQEEQKQEEKLKLQSREQQKISPEVQCKKTEQSKSLSQITRLYCVGCFACLQQLPPAYSVRKSLKFAATDSQWRVIDQICLLNGVKLWGFGNWGEIKDFMHYNSSIFTEDQIESHYEHFYLNCENPSLSCLDVSNIEKAYKPPKKLIEEIMHNYYYPIQSKNNLQVEKKDKMQNNFKRERPAATYEEEEKIDNIKTSYQKLFPPKINKPGKNPLNNLNFPSHTSLINSLEAVEQKQKTKKRDQETKKEREESDNQSMDSQEDEEQNEQVYGQTKLKPRSSSKFPDNKNHQNGGKCLKQMDLSRSGQFHQQNNQITDQYKEQNGEVPRVHPLYSNLKGHNVYSYNPKRKQFQLIEYDCYAESMLAQLQFTEDDTEQEEQLKLKVIEEYNRRLDERIKRRQFVIQHRLLDTEFMIKIFKKYNKNNVQKFQSFRRLIDRNQDYYNLVETYDTLCKTKAITEGMIKLKRKLQQTRQNPTFKDVLDYLNKKKEKKELLGHKAKYQNQTERKVLFKETLKPNKKLILSMSENPTNYTNSSHISSYPINSSHISAYPTTNSSQALSHLPRTMVSRSEQRSRLRNQNPNRQDQKSNCQQPYVEEYSNNQQIQYNNNYINGNTSLNSILPQDEINTIEKVVKRQTRTQGKDTNIIEFKPVPLKNYVLKPLSSFKNRKNGN